MNIVSHPTLCTVIVTVDAAVDVMPELELHARDGLQAFSSFEGFVSGALHKSSDGTRLVQYLQWQDEPAHLACMNDPRWDESPSAKRFMDIVNGGHATMHVGVFGVLEVTGKEPAED